MENIVILKAKDIHSGMIWKWRNDPMTSKMSFSDEKISWEEHSYWYKKILLDNSTKLYVGEYRWIPVGVVRFDECDNEKYYYKVNINISPEHRGKGFGKQLLTNGIKKLIKEVANCKLIRAEVKKENETSNKLFRSCGFSSIDHKSEINTYEISP